MRWRLLGLLFFALAGAVGWTFWIRPEAELWIKKKIETVLSQRVGQDIRLDSLSLHPLLLRIVATGVRVGPAEDPFFTCKRWAFYTAPSSEASPLSLFLLTFARSDLDSPFVRLPAFSNQGFSFPAQWWRDLPLHRVAWRNGTIKIPLNPSGVPLSVSNSLGALHLSPAGFLLNVRGDSSVGTFRLGLQGNESLRLGAHLDVRVEGQLDNAPLEFFSPWLPAEVGRFLGVGHLSVNATMKDLQRDTLSLENVGWALEAKVKDSIWFPPESRPKDLGVPFEGEVSFRPGRADLKRVRLFGVLGVNGLVSSGRGGRLDLAWQGEKLSLSDLKESGVGLFRSIPPRGTLTTQGTITGTLDHPVAVWTATLRDAGYPGILFPELTGRGAWKDDWLSLEIKGMSGQFEVGGTLLPPGRGAPLGRVWTVRAAALDLSELANRNGWLRMGGLLTGSFSLVKTSDPWPKAEGKLRIDDFAWGVHRETAPVEGRLQLDSSGLRVKGAGGAFDLDVRRSSGVWRMDRLVYDVGALRMWGQGFLKDLDGNMQLEAGVLGVRLSDIPPLSKRFPFVEGTLSSEGRWHGRWDDPVFMGSVHAENVRWRPGGKVHRGLAGLRGGRGGVTVTGFQWDDHVRGEGSWLFGQGGQVSLDVEPSNGEDLFDFLTSSGAVGGVFSGKVSLRSSDRPGVEGWCRIHGERGHWGAIPFEDAKLVVFFRGPRVEVELLDVRQPNGFFRSVGVISRRPLNPAMPGVVWEGRGSGESSAMTVGPLVLSGSWTARGFSRLREGLGAGELHGDFVTMEGQSRRFEHGPLVSLGDVQAKFSWSNALFRLDELILARGGRAEGEVAADGQGLRGRLRLKDVSLSSLFPSLSRVKEVRFGRLNGEGILTGSLSAPQVELTAALSGAGWKEVGVEGDVQVRWKEGLEVPRLSLRFPEGGSLLFSGEWHPDSPERGTSTFRLEGRLDPTSLGPLLRSFKLGDSWGGSIDGRISLAGSSHHRRGSLRLGGQLQRAQDLPLAWHSLWSVAGSTATVEEAVLTSGKGLVGEGLWRLGAGSTLSKGKNGLWAVHFKNDLRNMRVGPLQLFGGLSFDGNVSSRDQTVSGVMGAQSLWINQRFFDQPLADFRLSKEAVLFSPFPGARAFVQGRVRFDRWPQTFFENLTLWDNGRRILALAGELGPGAWDFSLQGWGLQAESLLTLADFNWPLSGPWTVKVRGQGSFQSPDVQAEILGGPGRIGPIPYDQLAAQAHWVGEAVDVQGLRLSRRKGYLLTGEGRFPVRDVPGLRQPQAQFNLHLTEGKLGVLKEVWPLCRSAQGIFSGDLRVEPGKTSPQVTGFFRVQDGRMDLSSYAPRVRDLNALVTFQNDRARVDHARARVGSGWIEMAGDVGIQGLSPVEYDLSIQSDGRRGVAVEVPQLSVPPGPLLGRFSFLSEKLKGISSGEPRVSLRVKGPHGKHVITGEAVLEETHFTYPPSSTSFGGIPGPLWWRNFWRLAAWDIQFKSGKETWYRNEYVNVRLDGGLHLNGTSGDWAVNGRVAAKEGAINYLGQIFQVKRGDFELVTSSGTGTLGTLSGIHSYLSGEAERVVTTVDARGLSTDDTLSLVVDRALLSEMQPRFVSRNNPDLKSDRVAMKALGVSSEKQGTPAERDLLFRAGLVQLVGASAAPLANRLAQKLGIGMISPIYEPPESQETVPTAAPVVANSGSSSKTSPLSDYLRGAGASARIRVTDRLSGVYKVKVDEAKSQTYFRDQVEIILRIKGSLHVRASTELDSEAQLGQPPERRASLENLWRFGLPRRKNKESSGTVK
ncbi:MAG: translocation/assembly module TamB domain-containing protein [Elusimicrobia bacterium]|nr:translocation/assembly module TamB domain-containing protein [Elusimicrobiota bacterium]